MTQNDPAGHPAISIKSADDLKVFLAKNYLAQIKNFFGDEKRAMRFLSSVMAAVQKNPKLLNCEPTSLVNSFITMAQLGLMPSDVSGEAFVIPYEDRKLGVFFAQFQLGYQGLVTLFYRAGVEGIRAEIVRENDVFSLKNGQISHEIDPRKSNEERGEPFGAYAISVYRGSEVVKYMNKKDILEMAKRFSKSYSSAFTPWKEQSDPELWMWKKTVLKQLGKLMPKNETIVQAIGAENEADGKLNKIEDMVDTSDLKIGALLKTGAPQKHDDKNDAQGKKDAAPAATGAKGGLV